MTETDALDPQNRTMPDPVTIERSGASFEWTLADSKLYAKDRLYFERKKIIPRKNRLIFVTWQFLIFSIIFGLLSSIFCIAVIYTDGIQSIQGALLVGLVLGGTGTGILFVAFIIGALRCLNYRLRHFRGTTVRVGVNRDILWISDSKALRFILTASVFTEVHQIEDVIAAYIDDSNYYAFPREALSRTLQGQKVIDWFEKNWPKHIGENAYRYQIPRRKLLQRTVRRLCKLFFYWGIPIFMLWLAIFIQS